MIETGAGQRAIERFQCALRVALIAPQLPEQAQRLDLGRARARFDRGIERSPQQRFDTRGARRIEIVASEPREGERVSTQAPD